MAKTKTALRVDVYPADYAENGSVRYRFKVVAENGSAMAFSAKSYARTAIAWAQAARLLLDPVDVPSTVSRQTKARKTR